MSLKTLKIWLNITIFGKNYFVAQRSLSYYKKKGLSFIDKTFDYEKMREIMPKKDISIFFNTLFICTQIKYKYFY